MSALVFRDGHGDGALPGGALSTPRLLLHYAGLLD